MTGFERTLRSEYMAFAKLETAARYNLASSGIADCALADLGVTLDDLELHGPNAYGWDPLDEAIAARFAIDPACVVTAAGASFANHLALAALVAPGDEILVPAPYWTTYPESIALAGGVPVVVSADETTGFRVSVDDLERALTARTKALLFVSPAGWSTTRCRFWCPSWPTVAWWPTGWPRPTP